MTNPILVSLAYIMKMLAPFAAVLLIACFVYWATKDNGPRTSTNGSKALPRSCSCSPCVCDDCRCPMEERR